MSVLCGPFCAIFQGALNDAFYRQLFSYFLIHHLSGLSLLVSYVNKQLSIPWNKEAKVSESQKILHLILAKRLRSVWTFGSGLCLGSLWSLQLRLAGVVHHWWQAWKCYRPMLLPALSLLPVHRLSVVGQLSAPATRPSLPHGLVLSLWN